MTRERIFELEAEYLSLMRQKEQIEEDINNIKEQFIEEYTLTGQVEYIGESKKFRYIAPSTSMRFDSARLKKEDPITYNTYIKEVSTKGYIATTDNKKADEPETFQFNMPLND